MRKIAIITCVYDELKYQQVLESLARLRVPSGYTVEVITIDHASSIAAGYNEGMRASAAKYKIYLSEDARIEHEDFLVDMIRIFTMDRSIGMLGTAGAKQIPTDAILYRAKKRWGKMLAQGAKQFAWLEPADDYEIVQAVDGYLMATQYDIPWREDLFQGKSFYDLAQCVEFKRQGYLLGVPKQERPWCRYTNSGFLFEEPDREVFLDEYSKDIYPLVSILMPTYNRPEYFEIAFESALHQTYRNIEIIIGDGSTDDRTEKFIEKYLENPSASHIEYFRKGDFEQRCDELEHRAKGTYISWLFDDDVISLNKIAVMMDYFLNDESLVLVTSYRQRIDAVGNELEDFLATTPICTKDTLFPAEQLGKAILIHNLNFIGELSTAMIKKTAQTGGSRFGYLDNKMKRRYGALLDVVTWLDIFRQGNAIYLCDKLNYTRSHSGQGQFHPDTIIHGFIDWFRLIMDSYDCELYLLDATEFESALSKWLLEVDVLEKNIDLEILEKKANKDLFRVFQEYIQQAKQIIPVKELV